MNFIADLHIHSRFSLATSKQLNIPHLSHWAMRKGIHILGTGDFTHPGWLEELQRDLVLDEESGFYKPRRKIINESFSNAPLFCLQTEISCIYKKDGKTRKVHNLVYAPDFEIARKISSKLALIGNINSDGRPILGLDSRNLLEIILECSPECVLIPAHIWTPWFALFGSKSGFDRIEECYGDLTENIFALETGLSSDPAMNRCLSALDNFALISNSDAHSGPNLGREANIFNGAPSWSGMFDALRMTAKRLDQTGMSCRFMGTMEFFPEEGKYHLDGHRACGVVLSPSESRELGNICPRCGKPLTIGVLNRVMELADRKEPENLPLEPEARSLVPLQEVLAQIMLTKPTTRKVQEKYENCVSSLGSELDILNSIPISDISSYWEPLGEAISRLRTGNVILHPGYDGQYGTIQIFDENEQKELKKGNSSFLPGINPEILKNSGYKRQDFIPGCKSMGSSLLPALSFSPMQIKAIKTSTDPTFVMAGPGAGKTRVLIARIQSLLESGEDPANILAITFTRRAALEMAQRLEQQMPEKELPVCSTLHALAWKLMRKSGTDLMLLGEDSAKRLFFEANPDCAKNLWDKLTFARETMSEMDADLKKAYANYRLEKNKIASRHIIDYTDLLEWLLNQNNKWKHVLVDEIQDLSLLQYKVITSITEEKGTGFFGIGDPDQSIYGFRGAEKEPFKKLRSFWPDLKIYNLNENFRTGEKILAMARDMLGDKTGSLIAKRDLETNISIFSASNEHREAIWIANKIKKLIGSTSHTIMDSGSCSGGISPSDIAILVRIKKQIPVILKSLEEAGIPFTAPENKLKFWQDDQCYKFLDVILKTQYKDSPEICLSRLRQSSENDEFALLENSDSFLEICKLWHELKSWNQFFEHLAWLEENTNISEMSTGVRILTLHASKGLEFSTVFIPGLENGIIPLDRNLILNRTDLPLPDLDEEKRLLYVGITRAANNVFLSYCKKHHLYGKELSLTPSPWLEQLKKYGRSTKQTRKQKQIAQSLDLFTYE